MHSAFFGGGGGFQVSMHQGHRWVIAQISFTNRVSMLSSYRINDLSTSIFSELSPILARCGVYNTQTDVLYLVSRDESIKSYVRPGAEYC